MGIRKSVFGSNSERKHYKHLARNWGDRYRIYHNLPFLNVFDVSNLIDWSNLEELKGITIGDVDLSRLKKTSIDFTLCDEHDSPILCIEFDGIQDGFNVGNKYHTDLPEVISSPWRQIIMDLKLKVAHGSLFPFVVVGSPHFRHINKDKDLELAIVDGIIGDVLSSKAVSERIGRGFESENIGMSQEDFDALSPVQQHELIQDWVIGVEVEADFTHNPIFSACDRLQNEMGVSGFHVQWLTYPNADEARNSAERKRMIDQAILIGSKVTVEHPTVGSVPATVLLPNFKTVGIRTLSLSQEIAHLLALDELKNKLHQT